MLWSPELRSKNTYDKINRIHHDVEEKNLSPRVLSPRTHFSFLLEPLTWRPINNLQNGPLRIGPYHYTWHETITMSRKANLDGYNKPTTSEPKP